MPVELEDPEVAAPTGPRIGDLVKAPEFLAKTPAERAAARGELLRGVIERDPALARLWVATDDNGRQRIADQWRGELAKRYPEAFKTGGYVFTESRAFKGNFEPVHVDVPVLDAHTESVLAGVAPLAEERDGKTYMRRNPAAAELLNKIEDPEARKRVGTLMRMRFGQLAPEMAEVTKDITVPVKHERRVGGLYDYPVLIPNALRTLGAVGGTAVGVVATKTPAGSAAGGAIGAAGVEPVAQYLEKNVFHTREDYSAAEAAVNTAIGAFPAAPLKGAGVALRMGVRGAEGAGAAATIYATQAGLNPDSEFSWAELGKHAGMGFALGGTLGAVEARFVGSKLGIDPKRIEGVPLLKVADEVAAAKRMSREEALEFIKDSINIGPESTAVAARGGTADVPYLNSRGRRLQRRAEERQQLAIEGPTGGGTGNVPRLMPPDEPIRQAPTEPRPGTSAGAEISPTPAAVPEAPAGAVTVPETGKVVKIGSRPRVGMPAHGEPDLLNAIEELGGIRSPSVVRDVGGEYDGFAETFTVPEVRGPVRLLVNRTTRTTPDDLVEQLREMGYNFDSPYAMYDAVKAANAAREKARHDIGAVTQRAKFIDLVSTPPEGLPRGRGHVGKEAVPSDGLQEGDKFKVGREPVEVVDIDPDSGAAIVKDGDRYPGKFELPAGENVTIDKGTLKRPRRKKAAADPWGSKAGAIDPQLLVAGGAAAARAGVGAAIGFAQGDTPEDRLGLALAYGLAGATMSPALARKVRGKAFAMPGVVGDALRAINPEAVVGARILRELQIGGAERAALMYRVGHITRRMADGLRTLGDGAAAASAQVEQYLKGEINLADLPAAVRGPALEMRVMIDTLSDRIVQSGMVDGQLRDTIVQNMGSYLRRSFRVFAEEGWRPSKEVYDNFVRKAMDDGLTEEQAHNLANRLLDRETAENVLMRGGSVVGKNMSSFMRRKDLDEATRALLGEVTDPLEAFGETASRMANLVTADAVQKRIREVGTELGIFSPRAVPEAGFTVEMAKAGDRSADNFAGLWTTPEFRKAFDRVTKAGDAGAIWQTLVSANAAAKATKTLLNPESYAPNAIGAMLAVLQNGHLNPRNFVRGLGRGVIAVGDEIPFVRRAGERMLVNQILLEREVEEMIRLGVFGESVSGGDVQRTIRESFLGRARKVSDAVLVPFSAIYQGTDNTAKLIAYYGELARYRRAHPRMAEAELKRLAAGTVRATTQTYGEIPRWVKSASVVGVLPSFVNFTWEVFRNSYNIARIGGRDVKRGLAEGNPQLVRAGTERMAAFLALLGIGVGASELSRRRAGVSDEQEKALRRQVMPEWDAGGQLMWEGYDGQTVSYANQSYVFPPVVAMQGARSAMRGEDLEAAFGNFLGSLEEQFLSGSVLVKPTLEAAVGKTMSGRDIVRPQATLAESGYDRLLHVADKAYKPLAVNVADRWLKALRGEKGVHGEVYTVQDRVQRLMGLRMNKLEVDVRLAANAARMAGELNESAAYYSATHRLNLKPEEQQYRYETAERSRRRIYEKARQYAADARTLGAGEEKVIKLLRDGGMQSEFILGVLDGVYVPQNPEKRTTVAEVWEQMAGLTPEQRRAEILKKDVPLARALIAREREALRGRTERDKLVLNLGVDDGARARYMQRVLDELPTEDARRRQLAQWGAAVRPVLHQLRLDGRGQN